MDKFILVPKRIKRPKELENVKVIKGEVFADESVIKHWLRTAFNAGYDNSLAHNNGDTKCDYWDFDEWYEKYPII